MLKITNPGVWIAAVAFVVILVVFAVGVISEILQSGTNNHHQDNSAQMHFYTNGFDGWISSAIPTEDEAYQNEEGAYVCRVCHGDWYSCECPRLGE